ERAIDPTSFPLPHLSSNSICLFFVLIYRNELVILIRNSFKEEIYMFGQNQQHPHHLTSLLSTKVRALPEYGMMYDRTRSSKQQHQGESDGTTQIPGHG